MGRPAGSRDSYQRGRRQKTTQAKEATAKKAMARSVAVKGTRRGATNASRLLMQAFVKIQRKAREDSKACKTRLKGRQDKTQRQARQDSKAG